MNISNFTKALLILLLTGSGFIHASHFMGGEITYRNIAGDQYEVTLKIYRDCGGVNVGTTEGLQINGTGEQIPRIQVNELTQLCPTAMSNCSSGSGVSGIEEHVYRDIFQIQRPASGQPSLIVYSSCCRNASITNLTSAGSLYFEAIIDHAAIGNSSPQFVTSPITLFCVNQNVDFPAGAFDPDGDSLAYSLVPCLQGASSPLPYAPGFSGTSPLSTSSGFTIDQATGVISFTPNQTQVGVVCILVEEFRGGLKIGEVTRDIQVQVTNCPDNAPVLASLPNQVVPVGTNVCINISSTDLDAGDILTLEESSGLPGSTFTSTPSTSPVTGTFCWTATAFDQGKTFTVVIRAKDDRCPLYRINYRAFTITVPNIAGCGNSTFTLSSKVTEGGCALGDSVFAIDITPSGGAAPYQYRWADLGAMSANEDISNISPGIYTVLAADAAGCLASKTDTLSLEEELPVVNCPASPIVASPLSGQCDSAVVNYSAITATDNCGLAQAPGKYLYASIPFSPATGSSWTNIGLSDDAMSSALPIGFSFDFYENTYTDFYISSNGFITFNSGTANGCCSGQFIPEPSVPNNLIAFAWEDLNPSGGGVIRYTTSGTAPNRILIMEFNAVRSFGAGYVVTAQVVLYEGSNLIEIHSTSIRPGTFDIMTQGVENADGTVATAVPGRNSVADWSAINEGARFTYSTPGDRIDQVAGLPSGAKFPFGITRNTFVAYDINGNIDSCSFDVIVRENTPPVIASCPQNMNACQGDLVMYADPLFDDNCEGQGLIGTLLSGLPSGSNFPLGTTTVRYQYTDISGNPSPVCSFSVNVSLPAQLQMLPSDLCPGERVNVASLARDFSLLARRVTFYDGDPANGGMSIGTARVRRGTAFNGDKVFVSPTTTTMYWVVALANGGCEKTSSFIVNVRTSCSALIAPVAMLEGAFDMGTSQQRTQLQQNALLPSIEPYSGLGYSFVGGGGEIMNLSATLVAGVVDWVVIELRDAADPTLITHSRSALLLDNGQIVDTDGVSQVSVIADPTKSYYITIIHRNHLGVMTAQPVVMGTTVDFTDPNLSMYGSSNTRIVKNGKALLYAGDADGNGQVQNTDDALEWKPKVGLGGYFPADYNLDGQVQNTDRVHIWTRNVGRGSAVPK
ncbi:MAG: HYR domain-containing protein [Bacteroidia bacterium]